MTEHTESTVSVLIRNASQEDYAAIKGAISSEFELLRSSEVYPGNGDGATGPPVARGFAVETAGADGNASQHTRAGAVTATVELTGNPECIEKVADVVNRAFHCTQEVTMPSSIILNVDTTLSP
ncbi:hypothetical protein ACX6XY_10860 [Streptomyces sp. O3]